MRGRTWIRQNPVDFDRRRYVFDGVFTQILLDLGVRRMRVLSSPKRLQALSGFGLEVVEYVG